MVIGLLIAITAVVVGGTIAWNRTTASEWNSLKPTWWVCRQLRSLDAVTNSVAAFELLDRLDDAKVSKERALGLTEDYLQEQAFLRAQEQPAGVEQSARRELRVQRLRQWRLVVSAIIRFGLVEPDQVVRLLEGNFRLDVSHRPSAASGGNIPLKWEAEAVLDLHGSGDPLRYLNSGAKWVCHLESVSAAGKPLRCQDRNAKDDYHAADRQWGGCDLDVSLPPGDYPLTLTWRFDVFCPEGDDSPAKSVVQETHSSLKVLEPGAPAVVICMNEEFAEPLVSRIRISEAFVESFKEEQLIRFFFRAQHLPVPVVGSVQLGWEGVAIDAGRICVSSENESDCSDGGTFEVTVASGVLVPRTLTVSIIPDPTFAARETAVTRMWGKTIEIGNVEIEHRDLRPRVPR